MFFADLMKVVLTNLRANQTVTSFVEENKEGEPAFHFEVRVTRAGDLRYPATRRPTDQKKFIRARAQTQRARRCKTQ